MIRIIATGETIQAKVIRVAPSDLRNIRRNGWRLDWSKISQDQETEVYKLADPSCLKNILGLIALQRAGKCVEVVNLENSPGNVGKNKAIDGIAGALLAFAAQISFEIGGDGYLSLTAKSELIEHYQSTYGFKRVGRSHRMFLETPAARKLIEQFRKAFTDE